MNTLGKKVTTQFYKTPEDYARLRKFWAVKMEAREELPAHVHLTYKALIGRDWRDGFVDGSEGKKIALNTAILSLRWVTGGRASTGGAFKLFEEFLSDNAAELLLELIDQSGEEAYKLKTQMSEVS